MPRKHQRVTDRIFSADVMKTATADVLSKKFSIRGSSREHNVKKSTLALYVRKAGLQGIDNVCFSPKFITSQVFTNEMEQALGNYLKTSSNMYHGLTPKSTRRLAYEFAEKNRLKIPEQWKANKMAGRDWFTGFMSRHLDLSIRAPEATSLARISSFNKKTVGDFQNKLQDVLTRYSFGASDIYNLDETGVTTVQKSQKVIAPKGQHQVGQVTSRERGELITQVGIIGANGTALPPIWIFPRVKFDQHRMLHGVPLEYGALGLVHKSGWMTCDNFLKALQHFASHVRCSQEHKVLLIMDNHESHLSVEGIDFCRENGIVILTLPPHTSNKLQPLDKTVFGPFKKIFNQSADDWMLSHPGKLLTIYDLPELCMKAWEKAATQNNIRSGFRSTGIWPFDKNIFKEEDFLGSYVTDRPAPPSAAMEPRENNSPIPGNSKQKTPSRENNSPIPGTSKQKTPSPRKEAFVAPSEIAPYPKAPERKLTNKGPARKKSIIATDTPEREEILQKKRKKQTPPVNKTKLQAAKRKIVSDSSSEEEEVNVVYEDSSSDLNLEEDDEELTDLQELPAGNFIICKVHGKKTVRNYAAKIEKTAVGGYEVRFLQKQVASNRFKLTNESEAFVPYEDVVTKLPSPLPDKSARYSDLLRFSMDLTQYCLF